MSSYTETAVKKSSKMLGDPDNLGTFPTEANALDDNRMKVRTYSFPPLMNPFVKYEGETWRRFSQPLFRSTLLEKQGVESHSKQSLLAYPSMDIRGDEPCDLDTEYRKPDASIRLVIEVASEFAAQESTSNSVSMPCEAYFTTPASNLTNFVQFPSSSRSHTHQESNLAAALHYPVRPLDSTAAPQLDELQSPASLRNTSNFFRYNLKRSSKTSLEDEFEPSE